MIGSETRTVSVGKEVTAFRMFPEEKQKRERKRRGGEKGVRSGGEKESGGEEKGGGEEGGDEKSPLPLINFK